MLRRRKSPRAIALLATLAILATLALAVLALAAGASLAATTPVATTPVATTPATPAPPASGTPATPTACGAVGAEVLAKTAGEVAERIYAGEVRSSETSSDKRQIESDGPLLSAVERDDRAALKTAVHTLVYSHTHIVRLRVSRGSTLLFDEGGPYILAPVAGTLRAHGKTIGHFVFSVQDDLGYVKLETRFIGAPLILRTESGQVPVPGQLSPGPPSIPDHGPVTYAHRSYEAYSFNAAAYPSGRLRISLLLPVSAALASKSCKAIKTAELGLVTQRISRRFTLSSSAFAPFIKLTHTLTHALVYVRQGSRTVAGSPMPGPSNLPSSGSLRFHGADYEVSSFSAPASGGAVRVYVLVGG
jgi:hypothetical protein